MCENASIAMLNVSCGQSGKCRLLVRYTDIESYRPEQMLRDGEAMGVARINKERGSLWETSMRGHKQKRI